MFQTTLTYDGAQDLEKSKETLQKELAFVKNKYSLLKDKLLRETTALMDALHVANVKLANARLFFIVLC